MWRGAVNVLVWGLCFWVTVTGIQSRLPFPDVPAIGWKYQYFAQHKDEYDVLFLGSSRFYHHIIPPEFDEQVAAATGQRLKSFNAGYDGLWPPESYYLLQKLLALHPARLKWVVIDSLTTQPKLEDPTRNTMRNAYWHDWLHTQMALDGLRDCDLEPPKKAEYALAHWYAFGQRFANVGRGAELLGRCLGTQRAEPKTIPWLKNAGYFAGGVEGLPGTEREQFLQNVRNLSGMRTSEPTPSGARAFQGASALVRKAGAQPVYVIAPTLSSFENLRAVPGATALIALNDPKDYPVLYDPDLHYDGWHLNERGAHVFTKALAERFAETLQGKVRPR